jgi:hypothetical protein
MDFSLAVSVFIIAVLSLDAAAHRWALESRNRSAATRRRR